MDLACFFDTGAQGMGDDTEKALFEAIARWQDDYPASSPSRAEDADRLLDDPATVATFLRSLRPVRLNDLPPQQREAAENFAAERLVLCLDGWATVLPSRMRIWPVPSHLV